MKKLISSLVVVIFCILAFNYTTNAQSCTINLNGPSGHEWNYKISFFVEDLIYPAGSQGWSTPSSISVGTTYNVSIPYNVAPDCVDRWKIHARVFRYYGTTLVDYLTDETGALDSDEYYNQTHVFDFDFD